jgi:xylan 1,4-beta-xylosidase
MLLDEITWRDDGWPQIGSDGPSITAPAPLGVAGRRDQLQFHDAFEGDELRPGWLWPQDRKPEFHLNDGMLELRSPKSAADDLLGAVLARSCTSGDYSATAILDIKLVKAKTLAGLAAIGDSQNAIGLAAGRGRAVVWQRKDGKQNIVADKAIEANDAIRLRLTVKGGDRMTFSYSTNGSDWTLLGPVFDGAYMPPWDRNIRIALTAGQAASATARFEEFKIELVK